MFIPDKLDVQILLSLVNNPRISVSELADRVGVVRNTAQARMDRLHREGILGANDRDVSVRALGFSVQAVIAIQVRHVEIDLAVEALAVIPAVLQVEEVAGTNGDLLARVAARSTDDLQGVVHAILSAPGVVGTTTQVVLGSRVPYRVGRLLQGLGDD